MILRSHRRYIRLLSTVLLITFLVLIVPTVVIGELLYSASRSSKYNDLEGFNSIVLETTDEVNIQTWYTKHYDRAILVIHGHGDHSGYMRDQYGVLFDKMSFDQVYLDMRNHGRSDYHPPVSMGIEEAADVVAVLEWMDQQGWQEIVVLGTSMGSIAALLAENQTHLVDKIIIDSSFNDPVDTMNRNFEKNFIIQPWRYMIVWYLTQLRHRMIEFPDILEIIDHLTIPSLVAHGSADVEASPSFLLEVDELNNSKVQTIMVPGGEHSRLYSHQEYVDMVDNLLSTEGEYST